MRDLIKNAALGAVSLFAAFSPVPEILRADTPVLQTMAPLEVHGKGRGVYSGRVVWCHAPGAASAPEHDGEWWSDRYVSQKACDDMMRSVICEMTSQSLPVEAWHSIFVYHNGGKPYSKGEKIAIKINNNNASSHTDSPDINASPQMVLSLLRALVNDAGVPEECITVAEPSRFVTDAIYNKCHAEFPGVVFVDNSGGDGRVKAEYDPDVMAYSADNGQLAKGIAKAFTQADYVINMALLKGHVGQGVTLCGKNWYGAMSINPDWRKNHHNNFNQARHGQPQYMTFVDFMGHRHLGGKTILYLIDALYGSRDVGGSPSPRWNMEPFGGGWPCSLLGSMDPVAIDCVGMDLLTTEFSDAPDMEYCDMYLLEASEAGNAPSGTSYDPEGDGTVLCSLGVAEHWNNSVDRSYSRNLGKQEGIELIYRRVDSGD